MFLTIGIVGVGVLGQALSEWFKTRPVKLALYDKFTGQGSVADLQDVDIIFICVPTPFVNGTCDVSAVEESVRILNNSKVVVIKSTVPPGTTERLQYEYPQHKFLMNPEFLRAATSIKDMLKPDRQIVGYTSASQSTAYEVLALLPPAPVSKLVTATTAELIKYMGNVFLATKVIFANQFYELCQVLNIDYDVVRELVAADARIGPSHLSVNYATRGYDGRCLPKDVKALVAVATELGVPLQLLKTVDELNDEYLVARPT